MEFIIPVAIAIVWILGAIAAADPVDLHRRYQARKKRLKEGRHPVAASILPVLALFALLLLATIATLPIRAHAKGDYAFPITMGLMASFTGLYLIDAARLARADQRIDET
jgi:hypothetical protein